MLRRYQDCDGGSKHERLSTLPRTRSPDSVSDETGDAFAGARRGVHETRDAFAGGKWPEIGCFVRAKVSSVSNVCGEELAVVSVVSSRGSDPPVLVSSVSGEAVGGCCEVAAAPISAKKLAQQDQILGGTAKKLAQRAEIGRFWAVLAVLGELFRAFVLMEASRANFFALAWPSRGRGAWVRSSWWCRGHASHKSRT